MSCSGCTKGRRGFVPGRRRFLPRAAFNGTSSYSTAVSSTADNIWRTLLIVFGASTPSRALEVPEPIISCRVISLESVILEPGQQVIAQTPAKVFQRPLGETVAFLGRIPLGCELMEGGFTPRRLDRLP